MAPISWYVARACSRSVGCLVAPALGSQPPGKVLLGPRGQAHGTEGVEPGDSSSQVGFDRGGIVAPCCCHQPAQVGQLRCQDGGEEHGGGGRDGLEEPLRPFHVTCGQAVLTIPGHKWARSSSMPLVSTSARDALGQGKRAVELPGPGCELHPVVVPPGERLHVVGLF